MVRLLQLIVVLDLTAGGLQADTGPNFNPTLHHEYTARLIEPIPGYTFYLDTDYGKPFLLDLKPNIPMKLERLNTLRGRSHNWIYAVPNDIVRSTPDIEALIKSWRHQVQAKVHSVHFNAIADVPLLDPMREITIEIEIRPTADGPEFTLVTKHVENNYGMIITGVLVTVTVVLLGVWLIRRLSRREDD